MEQQNKKSSPSTKNRSSRFVPAEAKYNPELDAREFEIKNEVLTEELIEEEKGEVTLEQLMNKGQSDAQRKKLALEFFGEIQTEICNTTDETIQARAKIKKINNAIKLSEIGQKKAALEQITKAAPKKLSALNERRNGAIGICEKFGIDTKAILKHVKEVKPAPSLDN